MAKIVLGRAVGVLPPLMYVVDRLLKKHPEYEFVPNRHLEKRLEDGSRQDWVCGLEVFSGPDSVGSISFGVHTGKENKDGEHPEAFGIFSHKVRKQRGDRDTIVTADPAAAVRHALRVLGKKSTARMASDLRESIMGAVSGLDYINTYALRQSVKFNFDHVTCNFVEHVLFGVPLKLPPSFAMEDSIKSVYEMWLSAQQIHRATRDSGTARGYLVEYLKDDSLRVLNLEKFRIAVNSKKEHAEDADYLVAYKSFDELPRHMQDRIAVLKLADRQEPVFNTGVKTSSKEEAYKFYIICEADIAEHPHENASAV